MDMNDAKDTPMTSSPDAAAVTMSDSVNFSGFGTGVIPRAFIPGVDGNLKVTTAKNTDVVIIVKAGAMYPIQCKRFWVTGSVASQTVTAIL